MSPLKGEINVVGCPCDQRRRLQLRKPIINCQGVLVIEGADKTFEIPRTLQASGMRTQIDIDILVAFDIRVFISRAERAGRAIDRFVCEHRLESVSLSLSASDHVDEWLKGLGRPVVVRVAIGEREAPHPIRIERCKDLADPAPAVLPTRSTWPIRSVSRNSLSICAFAVTETS